MKNSIKTLSLALSLLFAHEAYASEIDMIPSWADGVKNFTKAFNEGDVEALESIKNEMDLANINDLGDYFFSYGAGMENWPQLISDALLNNQEKVFRLSDSFTHKMRHGMSSKKVM